MPIRRASFGTHPGQKSAVDTDLTAIKATLTDISDTELAALIAATYGVPQTAPGLLAWIEGVYDRRLNRPHGFDGPLQRPEGTSIFRQVATTTVRRIGSRPAPCEGHEKMDGVE